MRLLKSFIISLSVVFLFVGSIGVDIFSHFCKEDGKFVSYFVEDNSHCGDHSEDVPSCCHEEEEEDDDCCKDEMQHVQVKLDFFNNIMISAIVIPEGSLRIFTECKSEIVEEKVQLVYTDLPPPKSGREILTQKQYWLI